MVLYHPDAAHFHEVRGEVTEAAGLEPNQPLFPDWSKHMLNKSSSLSSKDLSKVDGNIQHNGSTQAPCRVSGGQRASASQLTPESKVSVRCRHGGMPCTINIVDDRD